MTKYAQQARTTKRKRKVTKAELFSNYLVKEGTKKAKNLARPAKARELKARVNTVKAKLGAVENVVAASKQLSKKKKKKGKR